ncbi:MAG: DNA translocase FtsK, partial [Wolbachia sp.]
MVQFLGLTSVTIATTIVYLLIFRPAKILLKILYLILINLGICAILPQLSLGITARYRHSGIIGNALVNNCPFYVFVIVTSIGLVGSVGWKRAIYSLFFLCKKIACLFVNVPFFRSHKTAEYSIAPLVVEEKHRITKQQPKERQKKATEEIFKPSSEFEFPSIHLLSKAEESLQRKQLNEMESNKNLSLLEQVLS